MKAGFGLIVVAAALGVAGCSSGGEKKAEAAAKAPEPLQVKTVAAQNRLLDRTISVTGALHPDESVTMSPEIAGRITSLPVDFGQPVRRGQVVAEIDKQELSLAVERSRAALAQALARLGLNPDEEGSRPETTPAIRQATAQMEDAKSRFDNASRLVKTGDISQERFTELEKAYQVRQAALEAARDESRTLWASVLALRTEVKLAQKRLGDATLRAPFDGEVSERVAAVGQYIRANDPVLTIVKTSPLRLRAEIPEAAATAVKPGSTLTFTTDAVAGSTFNAVVRELNPSLDQKSRTLTVEARIPARDARLRPGMFVQVQLALSKGNESTVVPTEAIYSVAGLSKIFVVRNGKAVEVRIDPGQQLEGWVQVPREQVNPGEPVAVSALPQLVNGQQVQATPKS